MVEVEWGVWQAVIDGRPGISVVLSDDTSVKTDEPPRLRTLPVFPLLDDLAAGMKTACPFEQCRRSVPDLVLDEAVR